MSIYIQKFGGSSLASMDHIDRAAQIVANTIAEGGQVVVVVSAMQGETDRLLNLFKDQFKLSSSRERAMLLATGEQVSSALFAMALQTRGLQAIALTGAQVGILTTDEHLKADIKVIDDSYLNSLLQQNIIPVVSGYQGVNLSGDITTLGRGGSDLTAVALCHSLQAAECQIFTDVVGIFSADPRIVDSAHLLDCITYPEMLEHATLGARVMQRQAVEYGSRYNVPIRVLSSQIRGSGTLITPARVDIQTLAISGIASDRHQGKITVRGITEVKSFEQSLLQDLAQAAIDIDLMMAHSSHKDSHDIKFTVHLDDFEQAYLSVKQLAQQFGCSNVSGQRDVAKLSVIGLGMQQHTQVASRLLELLSEHAIEVQLLASSACKVSVIIDQTEIEPATRLLHSTFLGQGR